MSRRVHPPHHERPVRHPRGAPRAARTVLALGAALVVALVVAGCGVRATDDPRPAPPLAGPDLDGVQRDVADLRGDVVLVAAWASWCDPCIEEMPLLADATERLGDDGLTVLGINVRDTPDNARRFVAEHDVVFPSVSDPRGTTAVAWGVRGLPAAYLVDRDGNLVDVHVGPVTREWLDTTVTAEVLG